MQPVSEGNVGIYMCRMLPTQDCKFYTSYFEDCFGVQVIHIFWITDDVVYSSFFKSSFVEIPLLLALIAIIIDYLELPVIGDLFYKIIEKERR